MKIVSLAPSNTEILYALGLGSDIIAVTRFCDYPEEAQNKPKVGGWSDADSEKVATLHADLVVTSSIVQEKIFHALLHKGVNVVHFDPRTLEQIFESMVMLGKITSRETQAHELVKTVRKKMSVLSQREANRDYKPRVYVEEWHKPPTVSGNWVPKITELAGGIHGLIKEGEISKEISTEEIVAFNPEVIIISWCGFHDKANKTWVLERKGWESIEAIKNKKVFVFDDSLLNRPGPRLVEGLQKLIETLHPDPNALQ